MKKPAKFILPDSRDALHTYLTGEVRLNRYDQKFMSNIWLKYISINKPLSTNQDELYEKIVHKYRKQLKKLGINWRDIKELPWKAGTVDLEKITQNTYFKLVEDEEGEMQMRLYFTFNKNHIDEVRALLHDDDGKHFNVGSESNMGNRQKYNFTWDNRSKVWHGPFNLYLFKSLYEFALNKKVKIYDTVQALVDKLNDCGSKAEWTPSVRIVNNRLYVSHITEEMLPVLNDIDPTDLSVYNIERMTKLGLAVPTEISSIAEYAESNSPHTEHVIQSEDDVNRLKEYVARSGRKCVYHETAIYGKSNERALTKSEIRTWPGIAVSDDVSIDEVFTNGYDTLITNMPHTRLFRSQDSVGKFALAADKVIFITIKTNGDSNDTNQR